MIVAFWSYLFGSLKFDVGRWVNIIVRIIWSQNKDNVIPVMSLFFYATADPLTSKCLCMQVRSGAFLYLNAMWSVIWDRSRSGSLLSSRQNWVGMKSDPPSLSLHDGKWGWGEYICRIANYVVPFAFVALIRHRSINKGKIVSQWS